MTPFWILRRILQTKTRFGKAAFGVRPVIEGNAVSVIASGALFVIAGGADFFIASEARQSRTRVCP